MDHVILGCRTIPHGWGKPLLYPARGHWLRPLSHSAPNDPRFNAWARPASERVRASAAACAAQGAVCVVSCAPCCTQVGVSACHALLPNVLSMLLRPAAMVLPLRMQGARNPVQALTASRHFPCSLRQGRAARVGKKEARHCDAALALARNPRPYRGPAAGTAARRGSRVTW